MALITTERMMKPKKCRHCGNYESDEDGAVCTAEKNADGKRWCEVEPELNHNDKPSEKY